MALDERVAVVTGGARGIGRAISTTLASHGAKVVVADINQEGASETVALIQAQGGQAMAVHTDVTARASVQAMVQATLAAYGRWDILVNNAALITRTPFEELTDDQWDRTLAINLRGPFVCSQEAVRVMKEQRWGRIIAISSVAGKTGSFRSGTDYAASKGGLIALTLCIARRYARMGITANVVAPGTIHTEVIDGWPDEARRTLEENTPMGILGEPQDIANAVAFLASEEARYITGEILDVNGGFLMD